MKQITSLFLLLVTNLSLFGQKIDPLRTADFKKQEKWVDSIYKKMTIDEKVGQLFMVQVFSTKKDKNTEFVKQLVEKYHIGGVIFSKGGPKRQAMLTNEYQAVAKIPLLVAMDAEWGLAMRLDSTYAYPWNMTLGAVKNNALIEKTGTQIAKHCKRLGVHIDFAPDIDINTNPDNPIIGNRAFGEDKQNVAEKGLAFTKGMQSLGVLANAKHFPGHGETSQDSHLTLPLINFSKERIEEVELYPFRKLISSGVTTIMVGHLSIPSLEKTGKPSSLSYEIVTEILQKKLGFNGLIFTDALSMKGVANHAPAGEVDLQAFLAGNDMLLMPSDAIKGIQKIKNALSKGVISEERLAISVKKILKAKYWAGLQSYQPIDLTNLHKELITKEDDILTEKIYENAITLIKNEKEIVPFKELESQKTAYLALGEDSGDIFYKKLRFYDKISTIKGKKWNEISQEIEKFDRIIIGVHRSNASPWVSYKFSKEELDIIKKISEKKKVILTLFTSPYALLQVNFSDNLAGILVAFQNHKTAQSKAAQIIYGAIPAQGQLPVSIGKNFPSKTSTISSDLKRLQYGTPESENLDSNVLAKIDSVASLCISQRITPSVQVLVARNGKVVYNKGFGHFTYEKKEKVDENSLYDLASLTKILATLPELIRLYDLKKINTLTQFSSLLPELKDSNKAQITIAEALSHYAQLQSWIPFYTKTIPQKGKKTPEIPYYQAHFSEEYPTQVAENMFLKKGYKDSIFQDIVQSNLIRKKRYWYSDLPYYLLQKYIENQENDQLNNLVEKHFYGKIGAHQLTFLPLEKFSKENIVPSEEDNVFRKQKIQGYVHDQGAAMLGGVAGHAGLFGNANEVAKIMQLYLQKGYYGGVRYFSEQSFDVFNKAHFSGYNNRRGLGFDKPQPKGEDGPTCNCVSSESFGHSGFTGTFAWADPKTQIIYVFLSNRTYPSSDNKKLINQNIRTKIQKIIQDAIIQ